MLTATTRARLAALAVAAAALPGCTTHHDTPAVAVAATLRVDVPGASRHDVETVATVLRGRLRAMTNGPLSERISGTVVTFGLFRALDADETTLLRHRGNLTMRPVLSAAPASGCHDVPGVDSARITSCDVDGMTRYVLGPAEIGSADVASAQASIDTGGQSDEWIVGVELRDAAKLTAFTGRYVGRQVAMVLDGTTESAPTIQEPITGGSARISGSFTERSAKAFAAVLTNGRLPRDVVIG